jgi:hypothetical protein
MTCESKLSTVPSVPSEPGFSDLQPGELIFPPIELPQGPAQIVPYQADPGVQSEVLVFDGHPGQDVVTLSISGPTSTGKTKLGQEIGSILDEKFKINSITMSSGEFFRLFADTWLESTDNSQAIADHAKSVLEQTTIHINPETRRLELVYKNNIFEQTFGNGHDAPLFGADSDVQWHVDEFLRTQFNVLQSDFRVLIVDARRRFPKLMGGTRSILVVTSAPIDVRYKILQNERPDACNTLSESEAIRLMHERDLKDKHLLDPLLNEEEDVIFLHRTKPDSTDDAEQIIKVIFDAINNPGKKMGAIRIQ